jgi:hypothetical protein
VPIKVTDVAAPRARAETDVGEADETDRIRPGFDDTIETVRRIARRQLEPTLVLRGADRVIGVHLGRDLGLVPPTEEKGLILENE